MERIEPPDPQQHEGQHAVSACQPVAIGRGDHEAAEQEEEVDEEPSLPHDGEPVEKAVCPEMMEGHHQGGDAAQTVQRDEMTGQLSSLG